MRGRQSTQRSGRRHGATRVEGDIKDSLASPETDIKGKVAQCWSLLISKILLKAQGLSLDVLISGQVKIVSYSRSKQLVNKSHHIVPLLALSLDFASKATFHLVLYKQTRKKRSHKNQQKNMPLAASAFTPSIKYTKGRFLQEVSRTVLPSKVHGSSTAALSLSFLSAPKQIYWERLTKTTKFVHGLPECFSAHAEFPHNHGQYGIETTRRQVSKSFFMDTEKGNIGWDLISTITLLATTTTKYQNRNIRQNCPNIILWEGNTVVHQERTDTWNVSLLNSQ